MAIQNMYTHIVYAYIIYVYTVCVYVWMLNNNIKANLNKKR